MRLVPITESVLRNSNPATFVVGKSVYVYRRGTTIEATLYGNEAGTGSPLTQPLTTDKGGHPEGPGGVTAYVEAGSYDFKVNGETLHWEAAQGGAGGVDLSPTGVADTDTAALKALLATGSVEVTLGAGTFLVDEEVTIPTKCTVRGSGRGPTIVKLANGSNCNVFKTAGYGTTGVVDVTITDLTIDGNKANNTTGSCLVSDGQRCEYERLILLNAPEDGIYHKLSSESSKKEGGLDSRCFKVHAVGCGRYGLRIDAHDTTLMDCQGIQCADTAIWFNTNGLMVDCHTWNYASDVTACDTGMKLANTVDCVNCVAEGASVRQVLFSGTNCRWTGGEAFDGTGFPDVPLFEFAVGSTSHEIQGVYLHNFGNGGALLFTGTAPDSKIKAHCYDAGESKPVGIGEPSASIAFEISTGGTTTLGTVPGYTVQRRHTFKPFTPGNIPNNTLYVHGESNRLRFKDNSGTTRYVVQEMDRLRTVDPWRPEGTKAENFPRLLPTKNLATVLVSGTMSVVGGLILPADQAISTVHLYSASTAAVEPTHQWVVLMDTSRKILAVSADKLTEAWGANSKKTFTLAASYTPTFKDEAAYVGVLVTATTVPTLRGLETENSFPGNGAPIIAGRSNTGLTTPLAVGETATALTANGFHFYVTVN